MAKNKIIEVQQTSISITDFKGEDYICITDMAKAKTDDSRAADVIKNWLRTRTTLEFLGTWEKIYNPDFKVVEFDHFKSQAGLPSFVLSPSQWVEKTNAIGIFSKSGRYGGNKTPMRKAICVIRLHWSSWSYFPIWKASMRS